MNTKRLFAATLALCLAVTIAVAIITPAFADPRNGVADSGGKTNRGTVEYNTPSGGGALANRPTDLIILAYDYDESMNNTDLLAVAMWVPSMNSFVPVAVIGDQAPNAQIKTLWNNTAVYLEVNGAVIRNNLVTVSDDQLEVWTEPARTINNHGYANEIVLMANLTVPVQLDFTNLPAAAFGTAFSVPAMSLMFRGVGNAFAHEETQRFPNGYTIASVHIDIPAWVHIYVPAWGYSPTVSGSILYHETSTIVPPA
jgi:hypothetical protein